MSNNNKDISSNERNNVYAYNVEQKPIHISEAESGRKGYFCMGCGKQMQAVHSQFSNRISYFRHDYKDIIKKGKCTYSDETYRHKLGKEILQRIKFIHTPAVYKFAPKGTEGKAYQIAKPAIVTASKVRNELFFFERDDGQIDWCDKANFKNENLLFQPDVTFFDSNDKPILLIELVATHKVSDDKKVKIRRLGIDSISVSIPKGSPMDIEKVFSTTQRTKWLFNNEEAYTEYIPVTSGDSETLPHTDELQRRLFEENISCRTAEINSLIRSITRCLESRKYLEFERRIKLDLQRVKENTERERIKLLELQGEHRKRIEERFQNEREQLSEREINFEIESKGLERRYLAKKEECRTEEENLDRKIQAIEERIWHKQTSFEERRRSIANEQEQTEQAIERQFRKGSSLERDKEELEQRRRNLEETVRRENNEEQVDFEESTRRTRIEIERTQETTNNLPAEHERVRINSKSNFEKLEANLRERIKKNRDEEKRIPEEYRQEEARLEREYEESRERAIKSVKERIPRGGGEFPSLLQKLVADYELLKDFPSLQRQIDLLTKAEEAIDSKTYKNWL